MVLSYGKHRGKDLQSVPREYLDWLLRSSRETVAAVEAELQRRDLVEMADSSWAERIVRACLENIYWEGDMPNHARLAKLAVRSSESTWRMGSILDGREDRRSEQPEL